MTLSALPAPSRLEHELKDKKPLYTEAEALAEAERCLYCSDAPCIQACPTEIDIPTFIKKIATGNVTGSAKTIFRANMLGYSCARVCPVEVLCVGACVYSGWGREPIQIGRLQRFATEKATSGGQKPLFPRKGASGKRVAMIGGGPASLACAASLALEGHASTIFEKRSFAGGLNTTGIAPYKLHAEDSLREVEWLLRLGHIEIRAGVEVGTTITGKKLLEEYDAVFLGVGLGKDSELGIPGENGEGVVGATAWIQTLKTGVPVSSPRGKRISVIGGGNTAIDAARECAQLGGIDVTMIYRRSAADMSGYAHEMDAGRLEGIRLLENAKPAAFLRDAKGTLVAVKCTPARDPDPFEVPCDLAIVAIGQSKLREIASQFPDVLLDGRGCVACDPRTGMTGNENVFAGGDCVNGGKEVVNAVAEGRNAARALIARWQKAQGSR